MASIRRRGELQWEARIRRAGHPVQCRTFETKARAEAWARSVEAEMDRGAWVDRSETESITLADALDRYAREVTPSKRESGQRQEGNRIRALQSYPIAKRPLGTIRGRDVATYLRTRETEGAGPNTRRLELALISHLFNVARRDWGMEGLVNPVNNVSKPKIPTGRTRRLLPGEGGALIAAAPLAFGAVICFAIETAMRRIELSELRWEDVDLAGGTVYVRDPKNRHPRTVPLTHGAVAILDDLPGRTGYVFGMSVNAITLAFTRARADAGLSGMVFHDLRHEATSRLFERTDLDIMEIRAITGHETLQMLARYTHLRTARLVQRLRGAPRVPLASTDGNVAHAGADA